MSFQQVNITKMRQGHLWGISGQTYLGLSQHLWRKPGRGDQDDAYFVEQSGETAIGSLIDLPPGVVRPEFFSEWLDLAHLEDRDDHE